MTDVQTRFQTVQAEDGWSLATDLYIGASPKMAVLISAGTGFPRQFYAALAQWLAARGAVVMIYDYRGIGGSGNGARLDSGIDLPDWGRLDQPAVLDALVDAAPGLPVTHIAHSVGGHFLGLMPNQDRIHKHVFVAVGSGFWGAHPAKRWPLEWYFWWGLGSYALLRWGYIKTGGGWSGEPVPGDVFRTWRRWSHRRVYLKRDIGGMLSPQHYDAVTSPIRSWIFSDDGIATRRAAEDILSIYPNAPTIIVSRAPSDIGVRRIDHEAAFRPGREALWQEWWDWLNEP